MNVAYLSASVIPSQYANSVHVMRMCSAMAGLGHEVELLAVRGAACTNPFRYYGVAADFRLVLLERGRGLGGFLRFNAQAASRIMTGAQPDLYYSRYLYSAIAAKRTGRPIVFEAHGLPRSKFDEWALNALFLSTNFCRLVVISEALRAAYEERFTILRSRDVVVAHDAADLPPAATVTTVRRDARVRAGYIGSLYEGRGIEVIVATAQRMPEIHFEIVGGSGVELEDWRRRTAHIPNITFHGYIPPGQLATWFERFDILLAPYQAKVGIARAGGDTAAYMSPLKIFEYMAFGKAIIASDLPVLREVLNDGVNAVMCPPDSVDDWVAATRRLALDQTLRGILGRAARLDVEQRYTWSARAARVLGTG